MKRKASSSLIQLAPTTDKRLKPAAAPHGWQYDQLKQHTPLIHDVILLVQDYCAFDSKWLRYRFPYTVGNVLQRYFHNIDAFALSEWIPHVHKHQEMDNCRVRVEQFLRAWYPEPVHFHSTTHAGKMQINRFFEDAYWWCNCTSSLLKTNSILHYSRKYCFFSRWRRDRFGVFQAVFLPPT